MSYGEDGWGRVAVSWMNDGDAHVHTAWIGDVPPGQDDLRSSTETIRQAALAVAETDGQLLLW